MIAWQRAVIGYLTLLLLISSGIYGFNTMMPRSWWFTYEGVEFVRAKDDGLIFKSRVERKREVDMRWEDTLFCDTNRDGKYENYSVQISSLAMAPPRRMSESEWHYRKPYPRGESCYLRSVIKVDLKLGVTRKQVFDGKKFQTAQY